MSVIRLNKYFLVALVLVASLLHNQVSSAGNISYIIAAKQGDLNKMQSRISDIVANVNTTAYKAQVDIYRELPTRLEDHSKISFSNISTTMRDTSQGTVQATARQLDVAIIGEGYFMVDTPRGARFTRNGNFRTNAEGVLTTQEGYSLLGAAGDQVVFEDGDYDISIREDGTIMVGVDQRGQFGVFTFEDEQSLRREGQGLYRTNQDPILLENPQVAQGMLEGSNVNSVTAMTDLIKVSRGIERAKSVQSDYHDMQMNLLRKMAQQ